MFLLSRLMPREEKFFDMFDEFTAILVHSADEFLALVTQFDRLKERSQEVKKAEHDGDEVIVKIMTALDRSFITPFDREDIHALASHLDDVLDSLEESAHRFSVFRMEKPTPEAQSLARIIRECCGHLQKAVNLCRNLKNADAIQQHLRDISRLENEADRIYRDTESSLFADPPDILLLIKLRELYSRLEETVDACREVSDVISEIVIKGT